MDQWRLTAWTYRQQRLGRAAATPDEALRAVVGVYSSHPTAPLALLARCQAFAPPDLGALEARRAAVRLPAMRQSIFLLPAETAARVYAATAEPIEKRERNLRWAGLDRDEYERLKPLVLEHTREPIAAADLTKVISTEGKLTVAVRTMAREGLILRLGGSLRADSPRYVATEAWLGRPLAAVDASEALAWLAEAYLRGYGPARAEDFAWWSGATRTRARAALAKVETVDVGGGLLLPADQAAAFERVEPLDPDALDVLPKWDAYTMGYAPTGRQRLVDDAHLDRVYSTAGRGTGATSGDGWPVVLRGGRVVATWAHRFVGNRLQVTVNPLVPDAAAPRRYAGAFDAVGKLLGATAVEVSVAA